MRHNYYRSTFCMAGYVYLVLYFNELHPNNDKSQNDFT